MRLILATLGLDRDSRFQVILKSIFKINKIISIYYINISVPITYLVFILFRVFDLSIFNMYLSSKVFFDLILLWAKKVSR